MKMLITVPGGTEAQLDAAGAAVRKFFAGLNFGPAAAAAGHFERDSWDMAGFPEGGITEDDMEKADAWDEAQILAVEAVEANDWTKTGRPDVKFEIVYEDGEDDDDDEDYDPIEDVDAILRMSPEMSVNQVIETMRASQSGIPNHEEIAELGFRKLAGVRFWRDMDDGFAPGYQRAVRAEADAMVTMYPEADMDEHIREAKKPAADFAVEAEDLIREYEHRKTAGVRYWRDVVAWA